MTTTIMAVLIAAGAFVAGVFLGYVVGKQDGTLEGVELMAKARKIREAREARQ